jgi:hypothetical protein
MGKVFRTGHAVNNNGKPTKIARLARALLADRARADHRTTSPSTCFLCNRGFVYRPATDDESGRFCSATCRELYDQGQRAASSSTRNYFTLEPGPRGFWITCAGCDRRFESKGLRCCTPECERQARERAETKAVLDEVEMESSHKRTCAIPGCQRTIPNWTNGRKTSSARKYCDHHGRSRPKGTAHG